MLHFVSLKSDNFVFDEVYFYHSLPLLLSKETKGTQNAGSTRKSFLLPTTGTQTMSQLVFGRSEVQHFCVLSNLFLPFFTFWKKINPKKKWMWMQLFFFLVFKSNSLLFVLLFTTLVFEKLQKRVGKRVTEISGSFGMQSSYKYWHSLFNL